jgi:hypothetical protein
MNASASMRSRTDSTSKDTAVIARQLAKQRFPRWTTFCGIVTQQNPQWKKAELLIDRKLEFSSNTISLKKPHSAKHDLPITATVRSITTRALHPR